MSGSVIKITIDQHKVEANIPQCDLAMKVSIFRTGSHDLLVLPSLSTFSWTRLAHSSLLSWHISNSWDPLRYHSEKNQKVFTVVTNITK